MRHRLSRRWLCVAVAALVLLPRHASAQTMRGWVLDESSGRPISGASVSVLHVVQDTVLAVRVTDEGPFQIFMRNAGNYRLRVEAFGYASLTTAPVRVPEETVIILELRVRANAVALDPLRVVAERTEAPFMRDVRARQAAGFGRFVTRDDLDARTGANVQDVLESMPGVRMTPYSFGDRTIPLVETRAAGGAVGHCFAAVYLNGVRQFETRLDQSGGLDPVVLERAEDIHALPLSQIEAIEVYRGAAEVPAAFSGSTSQCGVVAVWTRAGYDPPLGNRDRPQLHLNIGGAASVLSGAQSPGSGFGPDAALYWRRSASVTIGLRLQYSQHQLPAEATAALTTRLDPNSYVLPPGQRPLSLYVGGVETRVVVLDRTAVRGLLAGRINGARRSFSVDFASGARSVYTSKAWGLGGGAGAELSLTSRLTADAMVGHDWLFFGSFPNLDRPQDPTSATWRALSLRLGFSFVAARDRNP